jgi:hypothetical protein
MTFEELEADFKLWMDTPADCIEFDELLAKCKHLEEMQCVSRKIDSGTAIINGCIMLPYDDITL